MNGIEQFNKFGVVQLQDIIPKEIAQFLTHVLLRRAHENKIQGVSLNDGQVENSLACIHHDTTFDTIGERIWPFLEDILGEELIPTYSYARLYQNGNILEKHTDRPSCEISVTIQLGRSHNYSWPIYANDKRFDLAECSGLLYKGCEIEHWRNQCDGPDNYYSGQCVACASVDSKC